MTVHSAGKVEAMLDPTQSTRSSVPATGRDVAARGGGAGAVRLPERFVVTIDGQAATGKSSVGQRLAERLGAAFLDTGAMYRGATFLAVSSGIDPSDEARVLRLTSEADLRFDWSSRPPQLTAFGRPIGGQLRTPAVDAKVSDIAKIAALRDLLVDLQRAVAREQPKLVSEGRDQGSKVFPDALAKFFLIADPQERARRRCRQAQLAEDREAYQQTLDNLLMRDRIDSTRVKDPMKVAADAVVVDTTTMTEDGVVDHLERLVLAAAGSPGR